AFYSECCRSFVPGNLTAFMVDHVVVPFHHVCRSCGRLYDLWHPPYLHSTGCPCRIGHVDGPAVRGYDVTARSAFVISVPYDFLISLMRDIGRDWDIDYEMQVGLTIDLPIIGDFTIPLSTKGEIKLPTLSDLFCGGGGGGGGDD
ncbi:hypothetical protein B296_00055504, partial [Ensete ventricosum]